MQHSLRHFKGVVNITSQLTVKREIGSNLVRLVSDLANAGTIQSLEELVANAWDADATEVWIDYQPKHDRFTIHDTGYGMNEHEINAFFRLGDSLKASEDDNDKRTPKGRKYMGKFGIGTISLVHLCSGYDLSTVKEGKQISVSESFDERLTNAKPIPARVRPFPDGTPGTKITMRGLKFQEGRGDFTSEKLKRRIQWDFPLLADFRVYFNGEQIESRRLVNAQEYEFDITGDALGTATCKVYVCNRNNPFAGAYVYVNGRRVGDPAHLLRKSKLSTRAVAEIRADNIEDAILFDRGRFREDHPGVIELEEGFANALAKIEYDYRRERNRKKLASATPRAAEVLQKQADLLNKHLSPAQRGHKTLRIELGYTDAASSHYSPENGSITLDRNDPRFEVTRVLDERVYSAHVLAEVIEALAVHATPEDSELADFLTTKRQLYRRVLKHADRNTKHFEKGTSVDLPLSDLRLYEPKDIAKFTGRHFSVYRKLIDSGALPDHNGKTKGAHVLSLERRLAGYTSLYEIILESGGVENLHQAYHATTDQLAHYGNVPFILNVGQHTPCYFIRNEFVDDLKRIMDEGQLDLRKKTVLEHQPLEAFAHSLYLPLARLSACTGLTPVQVAQLIEGTRRKEFTIGTRNGNGPVEFSYMDTIAAARRLQFLS